MKVGPTVRIDLSAGAAGESVGGADAAGAAAAGPVVVVAGPPFFALGAAPFAAGGRAIFFALSSVTMISPCCSALALSSTLFSASDHVCPAALQAQDGLNSWRYRNAFGEDEYG